MHQPVFHVQGQRLIEMRITNNVLPYRTWIFLQTLMEFFPVITYFRIVSQMLHGPIVNIVRFAHIYRVLETASILIPLLRMNHIYRGIVKKVMQRASFDDRQWNIAAAFR